MGTHPQQVLQTGCQHRRLGCVVDRGRATARQHQARWRAGIERPALVVAQGHSEDRDEVERGHVAQPTQADEMRQLIGAALLSTVIGAGAELGAGDDEDQLVRALRRGGQDSFNQTGQQITRRNLNIQPTITVRPGWPVRVIVAKDIVMTPFRGGGEGTCRS